MAVKPRQSLRELAKHDGLTVDERRSKYLQISEAAKLLENAAAELKNDELTAILRNARLLARRAFNNLRK